MQVDDSASRRFGGTGLGLAICRQLVELMGGRIGLESRPGQGARFWFDVPFAAPLERRPQGAHARESAPVLPSDLTVLLVEDNPVNREVAEAALISLGCVVHVAEAGADAVSRAARQRYDAILMDCEMPGLDGYEATRAIRAEEANSAAAERRVPIIALTASATSADRARALAAGMDEHLPKPFTRDQLGRLLSRSLERAGQPSLAVASST